MTRKTLGRYPELSLSEARVKAGDLLSDMAKGHVEARKAVPVFAAVLEEWFARDQEGKRGIGEKRRALSVDVLPKLGRVPIDAIGKRDIRSILDGIVARGAPIHANRVLASCGAYSTGRSSATSLRCRPPRKSRRQAPNAAATALFRPPNLPAVWNATALVGSAVRRLFPACLF